MGDPEAGMDSGLCSVPVAFQTYHASFIPTLFVSNRNSLFVKLTGIPR